MNKTIRRIKINSNISRVWLDDVKLRRWTWKTIRRWTLDVADNKQHSTLDNGWRLATPCTSSHLTTTTGYAHTRILPRTERRNEGRDGSVRARTTNSRQRFGNDRDGIRTYENITANRIKTNEERERNAPVTTTQSKNFSDPKANGTT